MTSPTQIDRYEILQELGIGGMGAVYKAKDPALLRMVAIKLIRPGNFQKETAKARFHREIELSSRLQHPNIVKLYDVGSFEGGTYMVMEYVEGESILSYFDRKRLPLEEKLSALSKIADALEYAHKKGIVHRDVKPSNVLVRKDGEPFLLDFGVAKMTNVSDLSITKSGEVIGTPQYMSPEQALGEKRNLDSRTDVYGLGALLYHVLTGTPPFQGETLMGILQQVSGKPPLPPRSLFPELPVPVEQICLKSLQKRREDRYASAGAFADDIRRYLKGEKIAAASFFARKKRVKAAQIALISALMVVIAYLLHATLFLLKGTEGSVSFETYYDRGKQALHPEDSYHEFSKSLESLERSRGRLALSNYSEWKERVVLALVETCYRQGEKITSKNPEEAKVYYDRASKWSLLLSSKKREEWKERLSCAGVAVFFQGGNYQKAYEKGKSEIIPWRDLETDWMIAVSAYHCEEEDALERLEKLQQILPKEQVEQYAGVLYYQGMIWLHGENYKKAQSFFESALNALELGKRKGRFWNALALHYCSTLLLDIDRSFSKDEMEQISKYLLSIEGEIESSILYKESQARYLLIRIMKSAGGKQEPDPQEIERSLSLVQECLDQDPENAGYYYMRSKCHFYRKEYRKVLADLEEASRLNPSNLHLLFAQFPVFLEYGNPGEFQDYYNQFSKQLGKLMGVDPVPFAPEFDSLRKEYGRLRFNRSRSIPFSEESLERFYRNLFVKAPEIRSLAENAITSMSPRNKVIEYLSRYGKGELEERLRKKIQELSEEEERSDVLIHLAQVPAKGAIKKSQKTYFGRHIPLLQKVLHDEEAKLSLASPGSWIWMRFLAARILTFFPEEREALSSRHLSEESSSSTTRILIARALFEVGFTFFEKKFLMEYAGENEFLQSCIAEILAKKEASYDKKHQKTLQRLVEHGVTDRVRAIAASVSPKNDLQMIPSLLKTLSAGHQSKNPQVRALCVLSLWGRFYEHLKTGERFKPYLPLLKESLADRSPLVQRAAQVNLKNMEEHIDLGEMETIMEKNLEQTIDPFMRCHTIIALAEIGNQSVIEKIWENTQGPFLERLACLIGMGHVKVSYGKKSSKAAFFLQQAPRLLSHGEHQFFKGTFLYIIFRGAAQKIDSRLSFVYSMLRRQFLELLKGKEPSSLLITIIALPYLSSYPDGLHKRLHDILEGDSPLHIKGGTLGVLLCDAYKNKSKTLERLHLFAKDGPFKSPQEAHVYRLSAVWGYTRVLAIHMESDRGYDESVNFEDSPIRHHRMQRLKSVCTNSPALRQQCIGALEKMMEIMDSISPKGEQELRILEEYGYMLCFLYDINGQRKKGIRLAESFEKMGIFSARTMALWANWMKQEGQTRKAFEHLENGLRHVSSEQTGELLRAMGLLSMEKQEYGKAKSLLMRQYILAPRNPLSLASLGELYLHRKKYDQAERIFLGLIDQYEEIGEGHLGMARVYASRKQRDEAILLLARAYRKYGLHSPGQLESLPEFSRHETGELCFQIALQSAQKEADLTPLKWAHRYRRLTPEKIDLFFRQEEPRKNPHLRRIWEEWVKENEGPSKQ